MKSMLLVDILARELKDWPDQYYQIYQDSGGNLHGTLSNGDLEDCDQEYLPGDPVTIAWDGNNAVVDRAEWQAAVEALKAEQAAELKWPDGATHYVPPQEKNENGVFYLVFNDNAIYSWALLKSGVDNGGPVYGEVNRHHLPGTIPRPTERAVEWDGDSLPPVGIECEHSDSENKNDSPDGGWKKVKIVGHHQFHADEYVCAIWVSGVEVSYSSAGEHFRPIRTQEQIAAEEREKGIQEIQDAYTYADGPCTYKILHSQAARLYDAGCRLQVAE